MNLPSGPSPKVYASKTEKTFTPMKIINQEFVVSNQKLFQHKKCVFIVGAGISVPSGIPDFRSPAGIFADLRQKLKTSGKDLFTYNFGIKEGTRSIYLKYIAELKKLCDSASPNTTHHFLRGFPNSRLYTQNIDGLEKKARIAFTKSSTTKGVYLHGNLGLLKCQYCGYKQDFQESHRRLYEKAEEIVCNSCRERRETCIKNKMRPRPVGVMHPGIIHYQQVHPEEAFIGKMVESDKDCDLLIVIGTSLKVDGVKKLVKIFSRSPNVEGKRIYVNLTRPTKEWEGIFDYFYEGDCTEFVKGFKDVKGGFIIGDEDEMNDEKISVDGEKISIDDAKMNVVVKISKNMKMDEDVKVGEDAKISEEVKIGEDVKVSEDTKVIITEGTMDAKFDCAKEQPSDSISDSDLPVDPLIIIGAEKPPKDALIIELVEDQAKMKADLPNDQLSSGQIPNDQIPSGQIPSDQIPSGQIPSDQMEIKSLIKRVSISRECEKENGVIGASMECERSLLSSGSKVRRESAPKGIEEVSNSFDKEELIKRSVLDEIVSEVKPIEVEEIEEKFETRNLRDSTCVDLQEEFQSIIEEEIHKRGERLSIVMSPSKPQEKKKRRE